MTSEKEPPAQVAAAIVAAMRAVSEVGKRGRNQEQGFKYRKYDDILSVAHDALVEAGLAIIPNIVEMKQRTQQVTTNKGYERTVTTTMVRVEYMLIAAADASQLTFTFWGEASDYGDKSLGKACSYADKMMLIELLKIPVGSDDLDPDQHSHADDEPVARSRPARAQQAREPRPAPSAAARRGAAQPKLADPPPTPAPPAESDDALHADIIERLGVLSDDPEAEGGLDTLAAIWGDIERARVERNAWAVEDYNALSAHVKELRDRIRAAQEARNAAAAAAMHAHLPDPREVDPWSDDPHEAAIARAAMDAAEGRTPMALAGPGNQGRPVPLVDAPEPAPRQGNPDARA